MFLFLAHFIFFIFNPLTFFIVWMHYSVHRVAQTVTSPIQCALLFAFHILTTPRVQMFVQTCWPQKQRESEWEREIIWRISSKKSVKARLCDGSEDYLTLFSKRWAKADFTLNIHDNTPYSCYSNESWKAKLEMTSLSWHIEQSNSQSGSQVTEECGHNNPDASWRRWTKWDRHEKLLVDMWPAL